MWCQCNDRAPRLPPKRVRLKAAFVNSVARGRAASRIIQRSRDRPGTSPCSTASFIAATSTRNRRELWRGRTTPVQRQNHRPILSCMKLHLSIHSFRHRTIRARYTATRALTSHGLRSRAAAPDSDARSAAAPPARRRVDAPQHPLAQAKTPGAAHKPPRARGSSDGRCRKFTHLQLLFTCPRHWVLS